MKMFPSEIESTHPYGLQVEIRSAFAHKLIEHFGIISGHTIREDSQGRAVIDLLDPKLVVERAFAISDAMFDEMERRGDIGPRTMSQEEIEAARGKLARIRSDAEWKKPIPEEK